MCIYAYICTRTGNACNDNLKRGVTNLNEQIRYIGEVLEGRIGKEKWCNLL